MKKKLHVLFLCGWYPSRVLPNNGDFIQRHAEAVALQHKVSVLHIISDKNCKNNIETISKEINGVKTHIGYVKKTNNPILKLYRFWKVYFLILKKIERFNVVHLNEIFPFGLFALHLKWFQKKPFIITEHWTNYHYPMNKNIGFVQKFVSKKTTKNASFICPVSKNLRNEMQKFGLKGNYTIVPNVVDTSVFIPEKREKKEFTITHISSLLDKHKNVSGMLKVGKLLEDKIGAFTWKFIGGDSKEFSLLINKLQFTSARIEFIPHIPQKKLVKELQNSDVFVLFSNYENLPCVVLESFSCGVPVIATNVGGIREYFPENYGKLIEKGNTLELLEALLFYYNNQDDYANKMHLYAKKHFSKRTIANLFSNLYVSSLKKSS